MKQLHLKRIVVFLTFCALPIFSFASGKVKSNPAWGWILENILLIIAIIVFLGVLIALWQLMDAIMIQKSRSFYKAHGIDVPEIPKQQGTFLSRWYDKAVGLIPIEKEADIVLDHDYDGIRELDNSLPPWWLYGFYLTIIISIGYFYVYQYSDIGLSQQEEYEIEMKIGDRQRSYHAAMQANNIDEENLVRLTDEKSIQFGKEAFVNNCSTCHGQLGEGGIGPNLTDAYWLHGGAFPSIYKSIKNGVPEKGMIAWKSQMQPAAIHKIASYIASIQGSNPPNPKEKQGVLFESLDIDAEKISK